MKKVFYITIILLIVNNKSFGQTEYTHSDKLLVNSFKAYYDVDMELSNYMYTFIKKRFIKHINDTTSFSNPHDSLSKYVSIKRSSNGLVKTYSWSERGFGCCHGTETYAQFKTPTGSVKYVDLDDMPEGYEEVFITDLQLIKINEKSYYLILGSGTCCGGKHYSTARIFEIKNNTLVKVENLFNGIDKFSLNVGANRAQTIALKYDPENKILSYNSYGELDDTGFYGNKKTVIKLKLSKNGFN